MSATATDPAYAAISNINFTGGFPTSADLAPSIVFIVLYAICTPLLFWRWLGKSDRTVILIRPTIFLVCRIAMCAIRAYMAKNKYGEGLLIAELVLVSVGYLFLIDPVVGCFNRQIEYQMSKDERPRWVNRLTWLIRILVITSIITAVAASSLISSALSNPDQLSTVTGLRKASIIIAFACVVVCAIATILTSFHFKLDMRGTIYILALCGCLIVVSVYRVVQTYSSNPSAAVRSRVAFWVLQMLSEFFAFVLIIAISIPSWFPGEQGRNQLNGNSIESNNTVELSAQGRSPSGQGRKEYV
ncbi:uncharacterized protein L201_002663 [Kwoniella dendrophila CBS 6074]|uniref:DUF7702 domain-containing protein n=1 Tax=Kwoniella dendrophila CBS 6074 TaxID=1295534 RepID=A0AAX4JRN0_9TREE